MPPHSIVEAGIALVPEGRGIFGDLTVRENLQLGAYAGACARRRGATTWSAYSACSRGCSERCAQTVRTMSGGEQQMVAIGRALMSAPDILMLDEPSLGLSPIMCRELFKALAAIRDDRRRHPAGRAERQAEPDDRRPRLPARERPHRRATAAARRSRKIRRCSGPIWGSECAARAAPDASARCRPRQARPARPTHRPEPHDPNRPKGPARDPVLPAPQSSAPRRRPRRRAAGGGAARRLLLGRCARRGDTRGRGRARGARLRRRPAAPTRRDRADGARSRWRTGRRVLLRRLVEPGAGAPTTASLAARWPRAASSR